MRPRPDWAIKRDETSAKYMGQNLTYNGETRTLEEWAEYCGILPSTMLSRIERFQKKEIGLAAMFGVNYMLKEKRRLEAIQDKHERERKTQQLNIKAHAWGI